MTVALRHDLLERPKARAVEPLVDAQGTYPAMERALLDARQSAFIALRVFEPETRLVSDEARAAGLARWDDLIADTAARGVDVRIALADFDPLMADRLHRATWQAVGGFARAVAARGEAAAGRCQIIAVPHEGEVGAAVRTLLWPFAYRRLRRLTRRLDADDLAHAPGLHPHLSPRLRGVRAALWPPVRLWPATHHQKVIVVDGRIAFAGGLDINARRFDTHDHDRPAPHTWHDVTVRLAGPAARDLGGWFTAFWNREVPRYRALLAGRGQALPVGLAQPALLEAGNDGQVAAGRAARAAAPLDPTPSVRVVTTRSQRRRSPFAIGPAPVSSTVAQAYHDLVAGARDLLYVETQFFREPSLTDALARRAREARDLRLVMVLPAAPEDVAFKGDHGAAMRHGEWLQLKALDRIRAAFGPRAGLFTLANRRPRAERGERDAVFGAGAVYVHAKIAVADDQAAIVSSANLNPRSMRSDTEVGVAWTDRRAAAGLRRRLFASHLGDAAAGAPADGEGVLALWRRIAVDNVLAEPGERTGHVLPFPLERTRRFARPVPFLPSALL